MFKAIQPNVSHANMDRCSEITLSAPNGSGEFDLTIAFQPSTFVYCECVLSKTQLETSLNAILSALEHVSIAHPDGKAVLVVLPQHVVAWNREEKFVWTVSGQKLCFAVPAVTGNVRQTPTQLSRSELYGKYSPSDESEVLNFLRSRCA